MKESFWQNSTVGRILIFVIVICLSCTCITSVGAILRPSRKPQPIATPAIHITTEFRTFTPAPMNTITLPTQADEPTITHTPTKILPSATSKPTKIQPTDTRMPTKIPPTSTSKPSPTVTKTATPTTSIIFVIVNKLGEYVDIKNTGNAPIDLRGWRLVSETGNESCLLGGMIQPDQVLRIWAGTRTPGYSCGFPSNIWNNAELDPAVLYNLHGQEVSRYP